MEAARQTLAAGRAHTDAQETPRGEMEVEKKHEPAPEEAMEE